MNSKELIKQLLLHDPEGNAEVVIDGNPINFVQGVEPYYYDGRPCFVKRDDKSNKIIAAGYNNKVYENGKLVITTFSLEDLLFDDPEFPIDLSGCSSNPILSPMEKIKKWKEQGRSLQKEMSNLDLKRDAQKFGIKIKNEN